jgi:SAM-dependent methyltransferase
MTSQDNYEYHGLMVKYWDLLRGDTSTWADRFMYLELIQKYGQPVLDVGCASGRLLLDYLAQKIDIDGVDISPEMIAMCERNADRRNFKPNLHVQDMTELSLPRKYKTILVPSSSLQLLLKPGEPRQAMQRFYDHLEPNGALVSPFMTLWREGDPLDGGFEQEALRPEDGATIRRTGWSRFNPETNMEDTHDTWEVIKDGVMILSEVHSKSPATLSYTQAEAAALFEETGFKDVQIYSEFTFDPVKPEDTLFTIVGVKP